MPELLFEIGTEELPPSAVAAGERQLRAEIERRLSESRLSFAGMRTFASPRRLAIMVFGLPDAQASAVEERRGPPVAAGVGADGEFTPAAVGFARANGFDPAQLERRETPAGEYLFAVRELAGSPTIDVLETLLADTIAALQFPKSMRWDASRVRFPRPVRWIVALLGDTVVPVRFGELVAGRTSIGHRVFHPGAVEIEKPTIYEQALRTAGVVPDRAERRKDVIAKASEAAAVLGGRAVLHDAIVDEVTDLVEQPAALTGRFESGYLEIPRDVIVTAMESHQRYFPVEDADGRLLPGFVVVTNGDPSNDKTIVAGNERVLRARLEDARFFFVEDRKISLTARGEKLAEVVFHGQLGSLRDKILRVGTLLGKVAKWLGLSDEDADAAFFAADLCKADLLTHLVNEFPELQGAVGREYALLDTELAEQAGGLLPKVADAIRDHYLPRFAGDDLPAGAAGSALGLADRLDTLVGYFGIGSQPSGSEDPYALRRQANGLAAILLASDSRLPIDEAVAVAHEQYTRQGVALAPVSEVTAGVRGLIVNRAEAVLEREGIARMFIEAARGSEWADLPDLAARSRALRNLQAADKLHGLAVAHERCFNLSKGGPHGEVEEATFVHDAERNLYAQLQAVEEIAREFASKRNYADTLATLVGLSEVVDDLFDRDKGVMINDPNETLKRNRLALLERTAKVFGLVADFSVIVPALLKTD